MWGGWLAGAAAAYGVGRLARPVLVRFGYGDRLAQSQRFAGRHMSFRTVLLLCMAAPSELPGYLCGSAHYPFHSGHGLRTNGATSVARSSIPIATFAQG